MMSTRVYPPDRFMLVPEGELSERHFRMHPVWSELYDAYEFDEIVSWGVDGAWLRAELERLDGNEHQVYPVLRPDPLPDRMRLFVAARFTTAGGACMEGWVMNDGRMVVSLFAGGEEVEFSRHPLLRDLTGESLRRLQEVAGLGHDPVFPLSYWTDFFDADGKRVEGVFDSRC